MTANPDVDLRYHFTIDITSGLPTIWKLLHLMDASAFVGTNPTGELITSGLSVTRAQPQRCVAKAAMCRSPRRVADHAAMWAPYGSRNAAAPLRNRVWRRYRAFSFDT